MGYKNCVEKSLKIANVLQFYFCKKFYINIENTESYTTPLTMVTLKGSTDYNIYFLLYSFISWTFGNKHVIFINNKINKINGPSVWIVIFQLENREFYEVSS